MSDSKFMIVVIFFILITMAFATQSISIVCYAIVTYFLFASGNKILEEIDNKQREEFESEREEEKRRISENHRTDEFRRLLERQRIISNSQANIEARNQEYQRQIEIIRQNHHNLTLEPSMIEPGVPMEITTGYRNPEDTHNISAHFVSDSNNPSVSYHIIGIDRQGNITFGDEFKDAITELMKSQLKSSIEDIKQEIIKENVRKQRMGY